MTDRKNFYYTKLDKENAEKNRTQTNPRYRNFTQIHFTAGDFQQFESRKYLGEISGKDKGFSTIDVLNTFDYIFWKFKKGIYFYSGVSKISNKKPIFLPFSNKNYINEWPVISYDEKIFEQISKNDGYVHNPNRINRNQSEWYANGFLVRYEYPIFEGDTNVCNISDMLECLTRERKVPDVEVFINKRDFPILRLDRHEAYTNIFGNIPLVSHSYEKYLPILSMTTTDKHEDIPIPTGDDWARVNSDKFFPYSVEYSKLTYIPWKPRKTMAVFRGSSTGKGVDNKTNLRLKLCEMIHPLLDVGITKYSTRPRVINGRLEIQKIGKISNFISPQEQMNYKFVINIDGHVSSFRLARELECGFCVLLVESQYKLWFSHLLVPYVHYVPVNSNLDNLYEILDWCESHLKDCEKIAENARKFATEILSRDGILDYLQKTFRKVKKICGGYRKPLDVKSLILSLEVVIPFTFEGETKLLKTNENSSIIKTETMVGKISNTFIHEAFVGNLLGMVKIYGCDKLKNCVWMEKINGITVLEYIHSEKFKMTNFLNIVEKIKVKLEEFQKKYEFVHNDLSPWNVLIKDSEIVFVDLERASVVLQGIRYSFFRIRYFSRVHDIITFLLLSIREIVKFTLNRSDISHIVKLMNWICEKGGYKPENWTIRNIREFTERESKFSVLSKKVFFDGYHTDNRYFL